MAAVEFDEVVDVVVVGSGGGALTGAYVASSRGLQTLVIESTDFYGGTTAYSGSGLWLPGNHVLERDGVDDTVDEAREYLRAVIGDETADLQDAFLASTRPLIEELERHDMLKFEHRPFPDYFAQAPHMRPLGRDIFPLDLERDALGDMSGWLRPTAPEERQGAPAPPQYTGGQALIARLLLATAGTGHCELRLRTAMDTLIVDDEGSVVGVEAVVGGFPIRIGARAGVLLAAGGFERNAELRERYRVPGDPRWSMGAPGGMGRPIEAGAEIGGAVGLMDQAWWSPGLLHPDGSATFTLGLRGGIFVNSRGERFINESLPYDQAGRAVIDADASDGGHLPFWFVFDDRFGDAMPAMSTVPMGPQQDYVAAGLWRTADTLEELAGTIGVPPDALATTVERFNGFCATGVDEDFGRGVAPFDLFFATGDGPNKALVPIDAGPYHAVKFAVSDLGTKGGLVTDTEARVLRDDDSVIPGVYAAGNTMASLSRYTYPAPGTPIGTCMVFSYRAVLDMERRMHARDVA